MLTVYHLEQSRSGRVIWLAEELGIEYTVETFKRTPEFLPPAEYKAVHPLGRSPVIKDGELVLAESGAIFEYLLERYGNDRLVPERHSSAYVQYLFWFHFAEGSMSPHHLALWAIDLADGRDRPVWQSMVESLAKDIRYVESVLAQQPFLAGEEFTACDILMCLALRAPQQFQMNLPAHPHIDAYLKRLAERQAYKKAHPFR
jgi:glutathione S-transferase